MKSFNEYIVSSFKGITMLLAASLVFVLFISVFPLIGSLTTSGFPLKDVMIDNFYLLVILALISVPLGFFLGIIAGRLKNMRILWMVLLGLLFYWLMILLVILFMSKFSFAGQDISDIFQLSVWAMLAYSFFAVPMVIMAVFLLERWTRK